MAGVCGTCGCDPVYHRHLVDLANRPARVPPGRPGVVRLEGPIGCGAPVILRGSLTCRCGAPWLCGRCLAFRKVRDWLAGDPLAGEP